MFLNESIILSICGHFFNENVVNHNQQLNWQYDINVVIISGDSYLETVQGQDGGQVAECKTDHVLTARGPLIPKDTRLNNNLFSCRL